jgi:hypothetical protein
MTRVISRIAVQPADAGAVGGIDRKIERYPRCRQPLLDCRQQPESLAEKASNVSRLSLTD